MRGEAGFTLVEVLVAAALMVTVGGAVLTALTEFGSIARTTDARNEAQQEARRALEVMGRELRNLASPTDELPNAVELAEADDLVFLSVGSDRPQGSSNTRNTLRVRYCLGPDTAIWRQEQTWTAGTPPPAPPVAACPESVQPGGWNAARVAATDVRNGARDVFGYNAATLSDISEVRATLYVDTDPARAPAEVAHGTTLFLRNQNRAPTASFTAAPSGSKLLLNGSESRDPEGKALDYVWFDDGMPAPVGEGIVFTYSPSQPGSHTIRLRVEDPAGLTAEAPPQTVCIPGGEVPCS